MHGKFVATAEDVNEEAKQFKSDPDLRNWLLSGTAACIYLQKIKKVVFRHLVDRRWFSQSFSTFNENAITAGPPATAQKASCKKSRNISHVYSEKNTSFSMKSMKSIFSADSFHASFLAEISKSKANKIMSNILCVSDPRISKKLENLENKNKSHGQLGENGQNASLMIKKNLVSSYQNKKKIKNDRILNIGNWGMYKTKDSTLNSKMVKIGPENCREL